MNESPRCRVALIGAGATIREHGRVFRDVPGVALVGIWNRTRRRAEALAAELAIPFVADSIPELFEQTHAELAVMAVIEPAISAVAKQCFAFPWTVLMEKPPGLNLADAREVQAAAHSQQRRVLVALNRRFLSSTRTALSGLNDTAGNRFITVNDQEDLAEGAGAGHARVLLDHWMYANSIHLVDYLRVFGRGAITAVSPIFRWNGERPDIVSAAVEFASGDRALYNCVWNAPAPWSVAVSTPAKRWEMRPLEQVSVQVRGDRRQQIVAVHPWDTEFKPGFRLQAANAVAAALGADIAGPTLDDALETMKLIALIYEHV